MYSEISVSTSHHVLFCECQGYQQLVFRYNLISPAVPQNFESYIYLGNSLGKLEGLRKTSFSNETYGLKYFSILIIMSLLL